MSATLTSYVRVGVASAVGFVLAWLVAHGIPIPSDAKDLAVSGLTAALIAGYYAAVRALEKKWPKLGVLLGKAVQVIYAHPAAVTVTAGNTTTIVNPPAAAVLAASPAPVTLNGGLSTTSNPVAVPTVDPPATPPATT